MSNEILDLVTKKNPTSRLIKLSDRSALSRVTEFIPTGCPPLDIIMGGGVPVGRMTEIYGDTSTGKTLLAEHVLAETQNMGGLAVLLDTETAIDNRLAELIGINLEDLLYSNPETVEDVYEIIDELLTAKRKFDPDGLMTIVWDSVAATSSREEIEKVKAQGLGAATVATHARLISKMMRVMRTRVAEERLAFVLLNQTREKIGVMFGDTKSTFGGRAIGYYSSVRLELAMRSKIKDKDDTIGINTRAYVAKSKVAPPFGKCTIPILFDVGIDEPGAVLEWLKDEKLITTSGGWNRITLGGEEQTFQRPTWPPLYEKCKEEVLDLMYGEEENENGSD